MVRRCLSLYQQNGKRVAYRKKLKIMDNADKMIEIAAAFRSGEANGVNTVGGLNSGTGMLMKGESWQVRRIELPVLPEGVDYYAVNLGTGEETFSPRGARTWKNKVYVSSGCFAVSSLED